MPDHGLVITNTTLQLLNKFKTKWQHPRAKHWHLVDYVIVKRVDLRDVSITRTLKPVRHSAQSLTDVWDALSSKITNIAISVLGCTIKKGSLC